MIISSNMTDFVCMLTLGVESLPDDMQRNISQMRELDLHYQGMMWNLQDTGLCSRSARVEQAASVYLKGTENEGMDNV